MTGSWATLAFLIFGFIILAYLLLQIYDRLRHDARQQPAADAPHLRPAVDELVRELRQAADQINADMTARANTLQKLVDDANETLKRLDAATQKASSLPASPRRAAPPRHRPAAAGAAGVQGAEPPAGSRGSAPGGASRAGGRERAPGGAGREAAVQAADMARRATQPPSPTPTPQRVPPPRPAPIPADGPWPGAPVGAPTVQVPRVAAASPAAASAYRQSTSADPFVGVDLADTGRFQTVRRLAGEGMSAAEIARATGMGREEVELIMRVNGEAAS